MFCAVKRNGRPVRRNGFNARFISFKHNRAIATLERNLYRNVYAICRRIRNGYVLRSVIFGKRDFAVGYGNCAVYACSSNGYVLINGFTRHVGYRSYGQSIFKRSPPAYFTRLSYSGAFNFFTDSIKASILSCPIINLTFLWLGT